MHTQLVIIRGNSGCGKTTLAHALQAKLGDQALVVSQDEVRLRMLHVKDLPDNLAIGLIEQIARYGRGKVPVVIVEGILAKARYQPMLTRLMTEFEISQAYYFKVSLTETLKRHQQRPQATEFSPADLRRWWLEADQLQVPNEHYFTVADNLMTETQWVLSDLNIEEF